MKGRKSSRKVTGRRAGLVAYRATALLAALLLLFSAGCQPSPSQYDVPPPSVAPQEEWGQQQVTLFLHYYDELGNEKTAPVTTTMRQGESRAMLAARALFESAEEASWQGAPPDWQPLFLSNERNVIVESVAVSGNTANVSLRSVEGGSVDLSTRVKSRVYLANTLIDNLSAVEYVNVFYNGKPLKYNNMALGAMGRYDGSPDEYVEELKRRSDQAYPMTINATLYFPHESGEYLVCETRPIEMTDGLGRAVMADLMRGPSTPGLESITSGGIMTAEDSFQMLETLGAQKDGEAADLPVDTAESEGQASEAEEGEEGPLPPAEQEAQQSLPTAEEGGLFSSFEQMLSIRIQGTADDPALSQAAVVCTILTLQDKDGAAVTFSQQSYGEEEVYLKQEDFADKLGDWVEAYAYTDGDFLFPYRTVTAQDKAGITPEATLDALWDRVGDGTEKGAYSSVFSSPWGRDMVHSVAIVGNLVIVDMKGDALLLWQETPVNELRLQIYAIVNSLCELYGINGVQILFDGQAVDMVGGLSLASPLVANPGLLQS